MSDQGIKRYIIDDILVPSINRLYEEDAFNIRIGVSERNICARLAHHMENLIRVCEKSNIFNDYYVDVEYNRMGYGNQKYYEINKNELKYMVSDLLIHSRGKTRNYLAVEMKRKGNYKNAKDDKERVSKIVSSLPENPDNNCVYGTLVGAYITYSPNEVTIEIFEDFGGHGKKTEMIPLYFYQ